MITRLTISLYLFVFFVSCYAVGAENSSSDLTAQFELKRIEKPRINQKLSIVLVSAPETVTANIAARSSGGLHDFYSEGDYWWPNPEQPDGAYIRRDGETNPDNFIAHRLSMIRLSNIIATLASAYILEPKVEYVTHARQHLAAWFVDEKTKMDPSLKYGQAIKGKVAGRSIGLIDTLHLVEVARGAKILMQSANFPAQEQAAIKAWFSEYLTWMNTHPFGKTERDHPNNHGVCWSLQAAAFADLIGDTKQKSWVSKRFKDVYITEMMNNKGGFPAELARTKPYGYSLFVLDAMATIAQLITESGDDLWQYKTEDGRGMALAMKFIYPYIADKSNWPLAPDILYWEEWPVRHPSLIFASQHLQKPEYTTIWKTLEADPTTYEILRNLPVRHPLLWMK